MTYVNAHGNNVAAVHDSQLIDHNIEFSIAEHLAGFDPIQHEGSLCHSQKESCFQIQTKNEESEQVLGPIYKQ